MNLGLSLLDLSLANGQEEPAEPVQQFQSINKQSKGMSRYYYGCNCCLLSQVVNTPGWAVAWESSSLPRQGLLVAVQVTPSRVFASFRCSGLLSYGLYVIKAYVFHTHIHVPSHTHSVANVTQYREEQNRMLCSHKGKKLLKDNSYWGRVGQMLGK